ncbi:imm11 family protein [Falsiroseomonas sp.]|uniref:imm11 family protein n=1 Tax=Falsiroseomonas sp. TaxID=2870721 RepID=UPI003F705206
MRDAPTPRFRTRSRKASNLADLCEFESSWWLLASARCAAVFARLQPEAVDILPVEVQLGDGTVLPAGDYAMVDVVNILPAYDHAASGLEVVNTEYGSRYLPPDYDRIILRDEVVAGQHLFRDEVNRYRLWVSVEVRDALRKAKVTSATYSWPDRSNFTDFDR